MKPLFRAWKAQLHLLPPTEAAFEKWLFLNAAGVLFGEKAGELVILRGNQFDLSLKQRLIHITCSHEI